MKYGTAKQIEKELAAIENGKSHSWGELSLLLNSIEKTGFWHRNADSFTEWIDKNASMFGVKPPMLWRIVTAGRFVQQIRNHLLTKNIQVPDLEELPDSVSAENVELLAKLERVLPEEAFANYAQKVFFGKVKRAELRSAWQSFRPTLGGKTARGRGVAPPRLNPKNPDEYKSLMEAFVLDALKSAGPAWSGAPAKSYYQVFLHVNPDGVKSFRGSYMFPAAAIIKNLNDEPEYHGFKFTSFSSVGWQQQSDQDSDFCDYLWNILPPSVTQNKIIKNKILQQSSTVGVLDIKSGKVEVLKPAERSPEGGKDKAKLISALLTRSLGAK